MSGDSEGYLAATLRQQSPPPPASADHTDKPPPDTPKTDMDFDDILPHIGEFGLYQKLLFFMMIPFAFMVAFVYFGQIFITLVPESHWCRVPELDHLPLEQQLVLSVPRSIEGHYEQCLVYDVDWAQVLSQGVREPDPSWPTKACDQGWVYNSTEIPYSTVATELNWVCELKALPTIAQSIFFCGAIIGGLIFGWMADRYGRISALVGTNLVGLIAGVLSAFTNSFWQFSLCRFFVGFAFDNCFTMMYILVLEYVGPKWRTFVANMSIAIFFTVASCLLPWLSLWVGDWRWLCVATSAPLAIGLISPFFVPESARWLVSQGRVDEAITILKKFERINKSKVPEGTYGEFKKSCLAAQKEEETGKKYSVIDLFRSPRLRNITILLIVIWMAISLVFDGHVRNVGSLGLDVFLTFTLASATELPADTFLTVVLDRWGRRWLACGSMVLSGVFSLLATAVPTGVPSASLAIMGRFSVNISYNIGLQYAAEILPTVVRAQGVALIHIMGYVASILAPFVVYLTNISANLPLLVLGVLGILGGILALFLPETMDEELPQTMADGENFGRDQSFFDIPCVKKPKQPPTFHRNVVSRLSKTSIRASIRGEQYRSSLINRNRSLRHTPKAPAIPEP